MAAQFPPFFQAIDGNGNPIAGAKLYFYRTGTSTLQDTYTTSALDIANANPVIANADGRFPPIYFGSANDYKAILKDADDVTVGNGTVDPIFAGSVAGRRAVADQNTALTVSDHLIAYTSLTASRSVSLLPASTYEAGTLLTIVDESGSASSSKTISVVPDGTDTINGLNATKAVITGPYGSAMLESDGDAKWTVVRSTAAGVIRGYIAGLITSNNGATSNTKIDVTAGQCADSTASVMMTLAAGTIDCGTTGANGLDAGSLANSTWYHVYAIGKPDGMTAFLASTSVSAPTMPTGYTFKRRIGSVKTDGSAHILAFVQDSDKFEWASPVADISATNPGTSAVDRTVTVPTGVNVLAELQIVMNSSGASFSYVLVTDKSTTDTAPSSTLTDCSPGGGTPGNGASVKYVRTNTSAQVRSRNSFSDASTGLTINTLGWIDRRGKES